VADEVARPDVAVADVVAMVGDLDGDGEAVRLVEVRGTEDCAEPVGPLLSRTWDVTAALTCAVAGVVASLAVLTGVLGTVIVPVPPDGLSSRYPLRVAAPMNTRAAISRAMP
jgi:hypothetical protein